MNERGVVLGRGPSDHRPFIKDLWYADRPAAPPVRVGFWNAHHGTGALEAEPTFDRMLEDLEVDLLILNEVKRRSDILEMLRDGYGLAVRYAAPEFAIAARRDRFDVVRASPLVMSEHDYWLERNEGLSVVLRDTDAGGKRLRAVSQHPPAHIVRPKHPTFDNVLEVHKDVARRNTRMAHNARRQNTALVIGRDSNIDPRRDRPVARGSWAWAYRGLDYVRAPEPTFGDEENGRHIDELLTAGLRTTRPKGQPR